MMMSFASSLLNLYVCRYFHMQCALASPGSFLMLPDSGRARTFQQRGRTADTQAAIQSCPVDCMHYVSFDELKKFETLRDEPVADHHRHFGHTEARGYVAATPLHVSRRDSDASHKDSFYQYVFATHLFLEQHLSRIVFLACWRSFQRNQCFSTSPPFI
jgi:ferredoxin